MLEDYAGTIVPYEMTSNAVIFDVKTCVKSLLDQFSLWCHVERGEHIGTAAATVDGGELAWWLTQVSGGFKNLRSQGYRPQNRRKVVR